jgi:CO/xanthine dehydrogenase Mo-binding subunit
MGVGAACLEAPRMDQRGKPVGEPGITGVAAAIADAVYHATGRSICDLPILMEKLVKLV